MGFLWHAVGEEEQCGMFVLLHVTFVALALRSHVFVSRILEKGVRYISILYPVYVQLTSWTASYVYRGTNLH